MTKRERSGTRGEEGFRLRYAELFGERWPALESALAAAGDALPFVAAAGRPPYYLDSASVFAASCLDIPEGSEPGAAVLDACAASIQVLDACAAPGGKSLVLAARLPEGARLLANELSSDRRRRLVEVLGEHLTPELRARVEVSGRDAAAMCRGNEGRFDAILLDAPCSSERHVLADPRALADWSPSRVKSLAMRQWALLSSALIMLKAGGCLVYSTCSLSPEENDLVVARAAARYGEALRFDRPSYEGPGRAEASDYGLSILPDAAEGAGPMYVCRMRKIL